MTSDPRHDRVVRRFTLVAIVIPLALVALGVTLQLIALPHVPSTIAVHWNAAGEPDRYAPAWTQPIATIAFGAGIPLLIGLTSLPGLRRGDRGVTYRFMGAVAAGSSALVTIAFTWTFVMQAIDSASTSIWPSMLVSLAAAVGIGVLGWFLQPHEAWDTARPAAATPLSIAPGEQVVWLRTTSIASAAAIAIACGVLVLAVASYTSWLTGAPEWLVWLLAGITVLMLALAATTLAFHVRVDGAGLTVRSVIGIPRFHVPLADMAAASRVDVNPVGEFGGWGIRLAPGRRVGVVLRAGEGIEVERKGGRRFVVTVDDAETGAALLEALVQREAAARS